ncbi:MAG: hypothetical protein OXC80_06530 [Gammaproteobacteria bacterium]|nr:hypothetical protein [Gammaproteobacteria bacterium]
MSKALHQPPLNTSQMGMVIAAANYFDLPVTSKQAFFESGHGFMVNTGKDMCPGGLHIWIFRAFLEVSRSSLNLMINKQFCSFKEHLGTLRQFRVCNEWSNQTQNSGPSC